MNCNQSRSLKLFGGLVAAGLLTACAADMSQGAGPDSVKYVPSSTTAAPATIDPALEEHSAPPDEAVQPVATPEQALPSTPAAPSADAKAAKPSEEPAVKPEVAEKAPVATFDAGAGTMQADGKTVVYTIPDGTGGNDWNSADKPIKVQHGMTLHLIDADTTGVNGGHYLHTNGQPCPHARRPIGEGFDCQISARAPMGVIAGTYEHNVANGNGKIFIEVVP